MRCVPYNSIKIISQWDLRWQLIDSKEEQSFNDQPACRMIEQKSDCKSYLAWAKNGLSHRGYDKPAYIFLNEKKEWWIEGNFIKQECL